MGAAQQDLRPRRVLGHHLAGNQWHHDEHRRDVAALHVGGRRDGPSARSPAACTVNIDERRLNRFLIVEALQQGDGSVLGDPGVEVFPGAPIATSSRRCR